MPSMSDIRAPSNTGVAIGMPFFKLSHSSNNCAVLIGSISVVNTSSP